MNMTQPTQNNNSKRAPYLRKQGSAIQLVVDDKPFLILGGELHNSSSSDLEYMRPIWKRMVELQLNTVLAAVFWELIEPEEGVFDFTLVDGLIQDARRHDLRLILLWFGSWKNGMFSYVPRWVKQDYHRFPLVKRQDGKATGVLSTLAEANWQADAKVLFRPKTAGPACVGIVAVDEGEYRQGKWITGRRLNGDETASGNQWRFPSLDPQRGGIFPYLQPNYGIQHCTVYRYE